LLRFNNFARSFLGKIFFFAVVPPAAFGPERGRKTARKIYFDQNERAMFLKGLAKRLHIDGFNMSLTRVQPMKAFSAATAPYLNTK